MLYTILLGFACALIVMAVVRGVGNLIVDKVYMSSDAISSRKAEIYSQFSSLCELPPREGGRLCHRRALDAGS